MIERSSHNLKPPISSQKGSTDFTLENLLFCVNEFSQIEMKKIANKYGLPPILVSAIIFDFKKAEHFLYRDYEGRA